LKIKAKKIDFLANRVTMNGKPLTSTDGKPGENSDGMSTSATSTSEMPTTSPEPTTTPIPTTTTIVTTSALPPSDHEWTFESKDGSNTSGDTDFSYHTNAPSWVDDADRGGVVAKFDGTNQCIAVADSDGKFEQKKFTLSFWFKADKLDGTQGVVSHGESFTSDIAYWVLRLSSTKLELWVEASDDGDYKMTSKDLVVNKWYHVIFVRNENKFSMYFDGVLHAENADLYNGAANDFKEHHPLSIGCRTNSGNTYQDYFKGSIDHLQWFNEVLAPADFEY